ncbi:MAG: Hpt domain-containing protein [Candidatus Omnitrophica bacterium]|nr:Hpt domain-containing protein [Candidatus Omnitrophota bacterium]
MVSDNNSINIDVKQVSEELRIRPEIYLKITMSFVNSLSGKLKILSDAMSSNDRDQMRMTLHEIKGTAGNLRLRSLAAVESMMHDAVKAGEPQSRLSQYFEALRKESEKLQQYMNTIARQN